MARRGRPRHSHQIGGQVLLLGERNNSECQLEPVQHFPHQQEWSSNGLAVRSSRVSVSWEDHSLADCPLLGEWELLVFVKNLQLSPLVEMSRNGQMNWECAVSECLVWLQSGCCQQLSGLGLTGSIGCRQNVAQARPGLFHQCGCG